MKKLLTILMISIFAANSPMVVACSAAPENSYPGDDDNVEYKDSIMSVNTDGVSIDGEMYKYNGEVSTAGKVIPNTNLLTMTSKGANSIEMEKNDSIEINLTALKNYYEDNNLSFDKIDPLDMFSIVDTMTASTISQDGWKGTNQALWKSSADFDLNNPFGHYLTKVSDNYWTVGGDFYGSSFSDIESAETLFEIRKTSNLTFIITYNPSELFSRSTTAYYYLAGYICDDEGNRILTDEYSNNWQIIYNSSWIFTDLTKTDLDASLNDSTQGWTMLDIDNVYNSSNISFDNDPFMKKYLIGTEDGKSTYNSIVISPLALHKKTIWYYLEKFISIDIKYWFENYSIKVPLKEI
ncbi:hypothetical protein [Spiroplasma endosymbiont of Labia minor]|uniref:hypothetical protein n=1 Tax=Spiroplasma endosymbiont of Labia minor TaxID=3066305 RepID=UPI0030D2F12A